MSILGIIASSKLGAPATAFESIASATGTGSSATITFSSIPSTYQHLQIRGIARSDLATTATLGRLQFNSDTGSNYAGHTLQGNGSSAIVSGNVSQANIGSVIRVPGTSATADVVGGFIIDIHDYASTSKNKTVRAFTGVDSNTANTNYRVLMTSGLWMDTSAINSISLFLSSSNWTTQTTFALYGIKGA